MAAIINPTHSYLYKKNSLFVSYFLNQITRLVRNGPFMSVLHVHVHTMKRQIYTYLKFSLELRKYSALPKQASVNESGHAMMYRVQFVQKTRTG